MLVDDKSAILTQKEFDELGTYDISLPTLTTIGKQWKRRKNFGSDADGWWLCEYAECEPPDPKRVRIIHRDILEVVPEVKEGSNAEQSGSVQGRVPRPLCRGRSQSRANPRGRQGGQ